MAARAAHLLVMNTPTLTPVLGIRTRLPRRDEGTHMNTAARPARRAYEIEMRPRRTWRLKVLGAALVLVAVVGGAIALWGESGMRGKFAGQDGMSGLEFRGSRVYVTTALGTTFVAAYEVDGNRVIIKGAGGAQVYTRAGDTLDGGVGIRFVKVD